MAWRARCMRWGAACGGYLLYAGVVQSRTELVTAAVLASGSTAWADGLQRCSKKRFRMSLAHGREWVKATVALGPALAGTFPILIKAALFGRAPGRLLEIPFRRGEEDSPADSARRVTALLVASFGPDNFVVRAPTGRDRVLMHAILPGNATRDPSWLNQ